MFKKIMFIIALTVLVSLASAPSGMAQEELPSGESAVYTIGGQVMEDGAVELEILEPVSPCLLPTETEAKAEPLADGTVLLAFKGEVEATAIEDCALEEVFGSAVEGPIDLQTFELETKLEEDHIEVKVELAGAVSPSDINTFEVDVVLQLERLLTE